jgi:hypothetical protein
MKVKPVWSTARIAEERETTPPFNLISWAIPFDHEPAKDKQGKRFTSFLPALAPKARKAMNLQNEAVEEPTENPPESGSSSPVLESHPARMDYLLWEILSFRPALVKRTYG